MFQITVMPQAELEYHRLLQTASYPEIALAIRQAMKTALHAVARDAFEAGEPQYDLKKMNMRICRIVSPPLYIEYGVHISERKAFFRRVTLIRKPA